MSNVFFFSLRRGEFASFPYFMSLREPLNKVYYRYCSFFTPGGGYDDHYCYNVTHVTCNGSVDFVVTNDYSTDPIYKMYADVYVYLSDEIYENKYNDDKYPVLQKLEDAQIYSSPERILYHQVCRVESIYQDTQYFNKRSNIYHIPFNFSVSKRVNVVPKQSLRFGCLIRTDLPESGYLGSGQVFAQFIGGGSVRFNV